MMYVMKKLNVEKHVTTAADKAALEADGYKFVSQASEPQAEPEQPAAPEKPAESEPSETADKPAKRRGGAGK